MGGVRGRSAPAEPSRPAELARQATSQQFERPMLYSNIAAVAKEAPQVSLVNEAASCTFTINGWSAGGPLGVEAGVAKEYRLNSVREGYSLGWSFTPLDGKKPMVTGWQENPRETLEEALEWAERTNVGLRTGAISGVAVVDIDTYKGGKIPEGVRRGNAQRKIQTADFWYPVKK